MLSTVELSPVERFPVEKRERVDMEELSGVAGVKAIAGTPDESLCLSSKFIKFN